MSLVDYGSSDSDDEHEHEQEEKEQEQDRNHQASIEVDDHIPLPPSTSSTTPHNLDRLQQQQQSSSLQSQSRRSSEDGPSQHVSTMLLPPFEKLPDAALLLSFPLLSQPIRTDHSARVAAAVAENASRKREANESGSSFIREKIPRSNLPHSKNIPETSSGLLTPPQLRGKVQMDRKRKREDEVINLSIEKRKELRNMNLKLDRRRRDSNIDRTAGVLCKLMGLNKEVKESLMSNLESTDISQFLREAVESICKAECDVETTVEVCSLLHRQYSSFSRILKGELWKWFAAQDMDKSVKAEEKLAFMLELFLVGILEDNAIFIDILQDSFALGHGLESDLYVLLTFATEARVLLGLPCAEKLDEEFFEGFKVDINIKKEYKEILHQSCTSLVEKLKTECAASSCAELQNSYAAELQHTYKELFKGFVLFAKALDISHSTTIDASSRGVEPKHKTSAPQHPRVRTPSKQISNSSCYFILNQTLGKTFDKFYRVRSREVSQERKHLSFVHNFIAVPEIKQQCEIFDSRKLHSLMPRLTMIMPGLGYNETEGFLRHQWETHGCKQGKFNQFEYFNSIINLFGGLNLSNALGSLGIPIQPKSWRQEKADCLRVKLSSIWNVSPSLSCMNRPEGVYLYEVKLFLDYAFFLIDCLIHQRSPYQGCESGDFISF